MKKQSENGKRKIIMPSDDTMETTNRFPDPVSRSYAFDNSFFEDEFQPDDGSRTAVAEYAQTDTPAPADDLAAPVYVPEIPATPVDNGAEPDLFSELFDSINEELAQMEPTEPDPPPTDQPALTVKGKNTVTYDEFRARFESKDVPEEPAAGAEEEQAAFVLHDAPETEAEDEPEVRLSLSGTEKEAEEVITSATDMNILLETEEDEDGGELSRLLSVPGEEEEIDDLDLRKTARDQVAEYYAEGEEPPELTAPYSRPKGNFFTRNIIPIKGDSAGEVVRKVIMIVALLAVFGSSGYLFNDYVITPYRTANQIQELSGLIDEEKTNVVDEEVQKQYPEVDLPNGMMEKYAALYARNPDFVGWLSIDELDISLPVVQGENNSKYLKTDFDGKKNKYGSLFVNSENDMMHMDMNTTIFGHNMKDSKMLGNLVYYRTVKGYQKAPVIEFNTIYADYKWKVFAVVLTNGAKEGDNDYLFNYMFTNLSSEEELEEYLGEIKQRSLYYPEVDIALSDKLLTISTCTYDFDEARLVILARMMRPGESTAVSGRVYGNENPRYPQAYYDKQRLNNPYAEAEKWYPS